MKTILNLLVFLLFVFLLNTFFGGDKSSKEANPGQSETKVAVQEPALTEEAASVEEAKLIPGITAADVKQNLKKWGFKFAGPRPISGQSESLDEGKTVDPDTNAELSCTITEINPMKITYLTFRTEIGSGNGENFSAITSGFLGYCATLPYDGAEPEKARSWVEQNVAKVLKPEDTLTNTFGNVEYTLSGTEFAKILSLKPGSE